MFVVAIPSYSRSTRIVTSSLRLCNEWQIPHNKIYVFVVPEQFSEYQTALVDAGFLEVHIISGPIGLHHMRNFITSFFDEDTPIIHMDDDIDSIMTMCENQAYDVNCSKRYPLHNISANAMIPWIEEAFAYTKQHGASLFGIYPVRNGFFMKDLPEITSDLRFCVGAFWGIWNRKEIVLSVEEKEDFERTLMAFERDGKVIRFNRICPKTNYYKTSGGLQDRGIDRKENSRISCAYLCNRWPSLCRLYTSKKNGMYEVRLVNLHQFS